MFYNSFYSFSRLSEPVPLLERSSGNAAPLHQHQVVVWPLAAFSQSAADAVNVVTYEFKGALTLLHKPADDL